MKAMLGSGKRFAALKSKLAKRPGIKNPAALASFIGRKKYGKAKFQKLASQGKRTKNPSPPYGHKGVFKANPSIIGIW